MTDELHIRLCKKEPQIEAVLIKECPSETVDALGFAPIERDEPYGIFVANSPVNFVDPDGLKFKYIWQIDPLHAGFEHNQFRNEVLTEVSTILTPSKCLRFLR